MIQLQHRLPTGWGSTQTSRHGIFGCSRSPKVGGLHPGMWLFDEYRHCGLFCFDIDVTVFCGLLSYLFSVWYSCV